MQYILTYPFKPLIDSIRWPADNLLSLLPACIQQRTRIPPLCGLTHLIIYASVCDLIISASNP